MVHELIVFLLSSELLFNPLDELFVCFKERIYADVNNNCEMFHICQLTARPDGSGSDLRQCTFVCGNQTVFSQFTMTCTIRQEALQCEYATQYYDLNKREEGRNDSHLHREEDVDSLAAHRRLTSDEWFCFIAKFSVFNYRFLSLPIVLMWCFSMTRLWIININLIDYWQIFPF